MNLNQINEDFERFSQPFKGLNKDGNFDRIEKDNRNSESQINKDLIIF